MMRIYYLIVLTLALTSLKGIAQRIENSQITIDGEIVDASDGSPVPFVHIINTSTTQGTASNSVGRFEILMSSTDSLLFSAIGFEKYLFTLSENIDTKNIMVTIMLDASTMKLEPVKIFAYKNEQSLKRAIIDMDVPIERPNRMQLDGFYYGPRKEYKITPLTVSPIAFIASRFDKKAKEKRKYIKVTAEYDIWATKIHKKYNAQIVQGITGLPEDEIGDFMKFCKLKESFVTLSSEYEIVVAIQKCFGEYTSDETIADTIREN